jgi:hypothetical protein
LPVFIALLVIVPPLSPDQSADRYQVLGHRYWDLLFFFIFPHPVTV